MDPTSNVFSTLSCQKSDKQETYQVSHGSKSACYAFWWASPSIILFLHSYHERLRLKPFFHQFLKEGRITRKPIRDVIVTHNQTKFFLRKSGSLGSKLELWFSGISDVLREIASHRYQISYSAQGRRYWSGFRLLEKDTNDKCSNGQGIVWEHSTELRLEMMWSCEQWTMYSLDAPNLAACWPPKQLLSGRSITY